MRRHGDAHRSMLPFAPTATEIAADVFTAPESMFFLGVFSTCCISDCLTEAAMGGSSQKVATIHFR